MQQYQNNDEMNEVDGGFLVIALSVGAKIAIGCFAGGFVIGVGYGGD